MSLLEKISDLQLEDKTKRFKQACFKENYKKKKKKKKRKLLTMLGSQLSSGGNQASLGLSIACDMENEEEKIKFLLSNSFSSTNIMI